MLRQAVRAVLALLLLTVAGCLAQGPGGAGRADQLQAIWAQHPTRPVELSAQEFTLFTQRPRNYSLFVVMTALKPEQRAFQEELQLVTKSWAKVARSSPGVAYFAYLEFTKGPEIFQAHNLMTAPFVFHYPPTSDAGAGGKGTKPGSKEYEVYDISRKGTTAESFARWAEGQLKGKYALPIRRPIDPKQLYLIVGSGMALLVTAFFCWDALLFVLRKKTVWLAFTMVFILIMISGQMWNEQRTPSFMGGDARNPEYFYPGQQTQHAVETPILAVIYGCITVLFLAILQGVPALASGGKQRIATFVLLLLFLAAYSVLLRVFRYKSTGYPFKLMF